MADGGESRAVTMPEELVRKFAAVRKRVRAVILAKGWTLVVFVACVCFGVSILLDRLLFLKSRYRLALFGVFLAVLASFVTAYLLVPLLRRITTKRIARSVEDRYPELQDLLLSTVELSEQAASRETYTSKELIGAVSREATKRTRRLDFRSAIPFSAMRKPLAITLVVVCGLGAYCYFRPMIAANVLQRLLYPYSGPEPLTFTELTVSPGDVLVPKGTDVEIQAIAEGKIPKKAVLHLSRKKGRWEKISLPRRRRGEFRYVLKGQLNPVRYRVRAGDARSETFAISVADRPAVVGIDVAYSYPDYTGLKPETKSDSGEIVAVRGSKVKIVARSNKELKGAKLRFGDGTESLVSIRGATIRSQEFDVVADGSYSVELEDTDGFRSDGAITHLIRAMEDKVPVVGIRSPDRYSQARPDEVVPVDFRAADDFGIETIWLEYTIRGAEPKEEKDKGAGEERKGTLAMVLGERVGSEVEGEYALSLAGLEAREGELVVFRIGAEDNNVLSGPGKGFSSERTIRIVSEETSYKKIEQDQQDLTRRLLRLIKRQKQNRALVETLGEAMRDKASLSEEEKTSLETVKAEQRGIEEEGRQLAEDFGSTMEKMRDSPLIQPRTLIEMAHTTKAVTGVSQNEMPAATQKASEAARSGEPQQRTDKLSETSDLQKKIIEALEQVGKEFARLQDEQRLFALAEAARKLAGEQLEARAGTISALPQLAGLFPERLTEEQKRRLRKLVEQQQKLQEKVSEFEERLRTLGKQLEYANSPDARMLAAALEFFEQGDAAASRNIPKDVNDAVDALRANHLHKGTSLQGRVYESLLKLAQEFEKARTARFQGEYTNAAQTFQLQQPEIDKLIELQRAIIQETERLPRQTDGEGVDWAEVGGFDAVSQSQKRLLGRTSNYRAILEEVFRRLSLIDIDPVTPLKSAEKAMAGAAGSVEKLKAGEGLVQERDSLKSLEEARDALAKALARMMSSAGLQQAMQAMSALDRMIQDQTKVNEGTEGLDQQAAEQGKLTDPMLEMLRQLINQQAGLQQQAMLMKDYLKMMVKAGDMMGQSAERLKTKQTGEQTQQIQSQVLELLMQMRVTLQAQADAMAQAMGLPGNAGTGAHGGIMTEPILRGAPGGLDDRWANLPPRVKQELLEAWTEKFSPEFRELIALYYKRLSGEEGPP